MRFLSLFSGIEAASVAWTPLGWQAVGVSEIEPFCCALLKTRYPDVPNLGSVTEYDWSQMRGKADVIVGGSPCQAFSVAGLRKSMQDDRGNLTLRYVEACDAVDPRIVVWENVPGVLSTKDNAFGCFLGALVGADSALVPPKHLGWTSAGVVAGPHRVAAWRILDAQFFGVPQRRRRVFVIASARGSGVDPAQILFEPARVPGDFEESRKAREEVAGPLGSSASGSGWRGDLDSNGAYIPEVSPALKARDHKGPSSDGDGDGAPLIAHSLRAQAQPSHRADSDNYVVHALRGEGFEHAIAEGESGPQGKGWQEGIAFTMEARHRPQMVATVGVDLQNCALQKSDVAGTLDTTRPTRGGGQAVLSVALRGREGGATAEVGDDKAHALRASSGGSDKPHVLAFSAKDHGADAGELARTLRAGGHSKSHANGGVMPAVAYAIGSHDGSNGEATNSQHDGGGAVGANVSEEIAYSLRANGPTQRVGQSVVGGVRRLTPRECERLQGFPDDYTLIPWRGASGDGRSFEETLRQQGKRLREPAGKECPDGHRYKAIGNSMAVPVMHWLGNRIHEAVATNEVKREG